MADWLDRTRSLFADVSYYHGRLSPEQADFRLNRRGCIDGLYLIYEDVDTDGKFILAICSDDRIRTYYLGFSDNGYIKYGDGVSVPLMHPHELIHYHLQKSPAFPVSPLIPCLRPTEDYREPVAWQLVTMKELETRMLQIARSNDSTVEPTDVLKSKRRQFLLAVAKYLHTFQPWFHGSVDRDEAERLLLATGRQPSGKFLIREKDGGNFALSMCYKDGFRHYTINRIKTDDGELLALDDEPVFENIMDIVEHYSNKPNSFVLSLASSCSRLDYSKPDMPQLDPAEARALKDFITDTWHLQNPDDDDERGSQPKVTQIDNHVEITTDDRPTIEVKSSAIKVPSQKSIEVLDSEREQHEDAMLDAVLSAVLPFDNSLLVEKIEV